MVKKILQLQFTRYLVSLGLAGLVIFAAIHWVRVSASMPTPSVSATSSLSSLAALKPDQTIPNLSLIPPSPTANAPALISTQANVTDPTPAVVQAPTPSSNLPPSCTATLPTPRWFNVPIDPSNYGERFRQDAQGRPVANQYLIVLHETVSSGLAAINTFRTNHPRDEDQRSYHDLILLDGTIVHLLDWGKRAFGAGNSEFRGEAVQTNPNLPSSVNNFALHFSLETPPDGYNNAPRHRGYTDAQYRSLAWLVAQTRLGDDRITTHKAVDRAAGKQDPRSFDRRQFQAWLTEFRKSLC
ncbi:peptidoglycan recognition family protein [Synechococcus sp. PCC 6312]|uniref:peptidoglycan recognition protein family protein n=1 Tax=Synechococcus sp. (strain ATCC 27167 / PCC 6312) TaxID=195253 RepID=UPI00029F3672|nr:peptidoglycan recognition family protein [Synechococcus sp. PCC 6312]AFY60061.1 negative regulator of beta-lactamase expression [Synechococcus sp. PCC 6312]